MPGPLDTILHSPDWQMYYGERAALEGLLRMIEPGLSIEVGTARGGSLSSIAAHSGTVHAFDLAPPPPQLRERWSNVEFHVGDSATTLPQTLAILAREGRHVDFALVDGDHSTAGVQRDSEALLASDACRRTVIVFHDSSNEGVRAGLEAVRFPEHPKVAFALLDFIPGHIAKGGALHLEIWRGLALVVLQEGRREPPCQRQRRPFPSSEILLRAQRQLRAEMEAEGEHTSTSDSRPQQTLSDAEAEARLQRLELKLAEAEGVVESMQQSRSWRITRPLRTVHAALRRLR
jgi:Methyltransferase domain